jgi:hypothetical protein
MGAETGLPVNSNPMPAGAIFPRVVAIKTLPPRVVTYYLQRLLIFMLR